MDITCALAMIGILSSVVFLGEGAEDRHFALSLQESAAHHLAAGRIEELREAPAELAPCERSFAIPPGAARTLPGVQCTECIRSRSPGLLDVRVEIRWGRAGERPRRVALETMIRGGEE
jgi:hypothetical protein